MQAIHLQSLNDFAEWRGMARALLLEGVPPADVVWHEPAFVADLFAQHRPAPSKPVSRNVGVVPQRFLTLAEAAICHSDKERFGLLYRLLWRLQKDHALLSVFDDPDVGRLNRRASAVRRDAHKMTAFVRFRSLPSASDRERFAAWFEPEHYVLERTAPFFVRRFTGLDWAILTPYRAAFWDGEALTFGPGAHKSEVPAADALEATWLTYFASIFNPARLKVAMMKSEMPVKYWRNLPEAQLIAPLIRSAQQREQQMLDKDATMPPARHLLREGRKAHEVETADHEIGSLVAARAAVEGCTRCPLYQFATQAVFGEGPAHAEIMFVGEQPGDQEDLQGKPFVGPAGKVFDAAMAEAGLDREGAYVTNAVKHFKFKPQGKRRLHQRPDRGEIDACRFWLDLERQFVKPGIVVAMGATAVTGILGKAATITSLRGAPMTLEDGSTLFVTVHPSYLLRIDPADREAETRRFIDDLRRVRAFQQKQRAA